MPPSVESTRTPSACLTRSTPKKRNLCSSKVLPEDRRKKSRGSSFLSGMSPQGSDNLDLVGQLTQESQKGRFNPDSDAYIHHDLRSGRPQEVYFPVAPKNDGFLRRATCGKEDSLAREDLDGSLKSMILHSLSLARSIFVAYEKERSQESREKSAIITELARLQTFHEDATFEVSQLRMSNEAAAAEVTNLQLENGNLAKKEAAASSKLDELQRQCVMRHAVNIVAAFVMSKALMLREQAESDKADSSEIDKLRFENAQITKETRETQAKRTLQIFNLQTTLAAAEREVAKLSSEKAEWMKEKYEREAKAFLEVHDVHYRRLEAANEEVKQVRLSTEALLREKEEAAGRAAQAAAVEFEKIQSHNETLLREMQTAREISDAEIEKMKLTLESTRASLKKVFLEKEEIAREKVESESRTKMEITQLQSEKAAIVAEQEKTSATAACEFKRLNSRIENAVKRLETIRRAAGLEKSNLQAEIKAKNSHLEVLKKKLVEVQAERASTDAQIARNVQRLSREKEEGLTREAALLEKLQARTVLPRPHAEMHLAFLLNCGLIRPDDYSLSFMPHGCSS